MMQRVAFGIKKAPPVEMGRKRLFVACEVDFSMERGEHTLRTCKGDGILPALGIGGYAILFVCF